MFSFTRWKWVELKRRRSRWPSGPWTGFLLFGVFLPLCFFAGSVSADPLPFGITLEHEYLAYPDLVSGLGAIWAREGVSWATTEPSNTTPDNYYWAPWDQKFTALEAIGLTPVALVYVNPSWASTTACGPLDLVGLEEYAEFVGALAERYDGNGDYDGDGTIDGPVMPTVTHWELYNEPDCYDMEVGEWLGGCWGDHGAAYAQLLAVAWEAMHAANPETVIVFGSMAAEPLTQWFNFSMSGGDFLDDVLDYIEAHPGNYFDSLGFHNYYAFKNRWAKYGPGIIGKAEYLRQRMASHGLSKPLVCTEAGLRSDKEYSGMPLGFEGQSRYVVMANVRAASAGIKAVTWYKMTDGPSEKWGLVDQAYQENPSYRAYQTLTRELKGATPRGPALLGEGIEGYEFDLPSGLIETVLWSTDGVTRVASLAGPFLRVTDKYGSEEVVIADGGYGDEDGSADGAVSIEVGGSPVYAEVLADEGIALHLGWNLVSVPVSPNSTIITDVLSSIEGSYDLIYAYAASQTADPWKKYDLAAPPFLNDLDEIDETIGLWIRATEATTLRVSGAASSVSEILLHAGWNLVGCPIGAARPLTEALSSIEGKYDLVYGYDPAQGDDPWKKYDVNAPPFLNDLTEMGPKWAYWIRVLEDCMWTLP